MTRIHRSRAGVAVVAKAYLPQTLLLLALFGLVLLAVGIQAVAQPSPAAAAAGQLLQPQGIVEILPEDSAAWRRVTNSVALAPGDTVRTGPGSRAAIRLGNDSIVRLDERSMLRLRPAASAGSALLNLLKGASYFFHRERPARTEFETPLVSGAVRGTEFLLEVADNGRSVLSLFDGQVELTNAFGGLRLATGEQAVVDPQQAPRRTAILEGQALVQWCLYYPAVIDPDALALTADERRAFSRSLAAYRNGDLPSAIAFLPEDAAPLSDAARVYRAALHLAAGQVPAARETLAAIGTPRERTLAEALEILISATTQETPAKFPQTNSLSASVSLAASYLHQSRRDLPVALRAAREAVNLAPHFGFAWARVAELEFSFGHRDDTREAIDRTLQLSPRHAPAHVVRGFVLADSGNLAGATAAFDKALQIDAALGNAWLGRGLVRIRRGAAQQGLEDLLVAAALEPNRAVLRSYLGKAFHQVRDDAHAAEELALAQRIDPNDPTAWLYSALLNQENGRINDAIRDLETSRALNDNRAVYRSRFFLDQDQAVRRANLANLYRDAGLEDVAEREAARAVGDDYANHSAHLFLAESYNLQGQRGGNSLRSETAVFSELLIANLLAPPGAGLLSRNITEQDYVRLFEQDGPGIASATEYRSGGDWLQNASQFGAFGDFSYTLDSSYLSRNGERRNNDLEFLGIASAFKARVGERDSIYLQTIYSDVESGDVRQFYDPAEANPTLRLRDTQAANVFAGWHREWHPQSHTLFLAGHLRDDYGVDDGAMNILTILRTNGVPASVVPPNFGFRLFDARLRGEFRAWTAEAQQIWQRGSHTLVAGARQQSGENETHNALTKLPAALVNYPVAPVTTVTELERTAFYLYDTWRVTDWLALFGALTYDRLRFPENIDLAPIAGGERGKDQWSPKLGLAWMPDQSTTLRAAWARSLGGLTYDNSVRLEPAQFGGFVQSYRGLIPDSLVGAVPGTEFETWHAEFAHQFPTRTYVAVRADWLESAARRSIGVYDVEIFDDPTAGLPGTTPERLEFRERSGSVAVNQLLGRDWSVGLRYKVAEAELQERLLEISPTLEAGARNDHRAVLHQLLFSVNFNHPSGFHSRAESLWHGQDNSGYAPARPGDELWQFNLLLGWRLWRRHADVTVGVLNLSDEDYRLNPLSLHRELPRERTLVAALRFVF